MDGALLVDHIFVRSEKAGGVVCELTAVRKEINAITDEQIAALVKHTIERGNVMFGVDDFRGLLHQEMVDFMSGQLADSGAENIYDAADEPQADAPQPPEAT